MQVGTIGTGNLPRYPCLRIPNISLRESPRRTLDRHFRGYVESSYTITALSLYGEYVVRFFFPDDVNLLYYEHGLNFIHQLIM